MRSGWYVASRQSGTLKSWSQQHQPEDNILYKVQEVSKSAGPGLAWSQQHQHMQFEAWGPIYYIRHKRSANLLGIVMIMMARCFHNQVSCNCVVELPCWPQSQDSQYADLTLAPYMGLLITESMDFVGLWWKMAFGLTVFWGDGSQNDGGLATRE